MLFASDHAENDQTPGRATGPVDLPLFDIGLPTLFAALRLFAWAEDTRRGQPWA
ncbi:hypothetical protein [Antarctobacter sp.]|uniref:hypothetical protein n=1 Tax=Antarctobacter sp. TaxID=1872577 RepID=UPI002B2767CE|nr:hypothetical protein [Antarctobacter sp.]